MQLHRTLGRRVRGGILPGIHVEGALLVVARQIVDVISGGISRDVLRSRAESSPDRDLSLLIIERDAGTAPRQCCLRTGDRACEGEDRGGH